MHLLKNLNEKIIKHDLINKYRYKNTKDLPKLKNITLNFGCSNFNIQKFAITLLALEILTSKKSGLTKSKSANVLLKIQKGQPAGCKVTLEKKDIYKFLNKLIIENLPRLQNFSGFKIKIKTSIVSFKLSNKEISLQEFDNQYPLFENLPYLDVNVLTTAKSDKELLFLLKAIKIPIYEKK